MQKDQYDSFQKSECNSLQNIGDFDESDTKSTTFQNLVNINRLNSWITCQHNCFQKKSRHCIQNWAHRNVFACGPRSCWWGTGGPSRRCRWPRQRKACVAGKDWIVFFFFYIIRNEKNSVTTFENFAEFFAIFLQLLTSFDNFRTHLWNSEAAILLLNS